MDKEAEIIPGRSAASTADGSEMQDGHADGHTGMGSPRTLAAKQMEMESELEQLKTMMSAMTGSQGFDPKMEPGFALSDEHRFALSDEHRFALQHRRYHEDSSESDDDDYTQFDHRRRQMERVLVRELKTLRREKDMIQSIRLLRRDREVLLEKERAWERERLALQRENEKFQKPVDENSAVSDPAPASSDDAVKTASATEPGASTAAPEDAKTEGLEPELAQHAVAKLNYVEWSTFKALRENVESKSFAIDVLRGEPVVTFDLTSFWGYNKAKRRSTNKTAEPKAAAANAKTDAKQKQPPVPERIRIHSKSILKILEDISGETLSASGDPIVMIRPYRFLVYHEEQIRLKFSELKDKFGGSNAASRDTAPEQAATGSQAPHGDANENKNNGKGEDMDHEKDKDKDKGKDAITTSLVAYEHLRCLIEFLDTEIQPKILSLSRDAGESLAKTVSFTDIWYLFKPGDEVIEQSRRQAYRVVGMTSVGHKVISPWRNYYDKSEVKSDETPVTLHCVSIDFDGKHLGPVSRLFEIPRFEGEKAVKSLDVYPLWYAEDSGRLRETLIARGRMFVDVAGIKHMHYSGLTLEVRDEVDSQVVVDFEEAFVARGNSEWRPTMEELIGRPGLPNPKDEDCTAECCRTDYIHKDGEVEAKRYQDYIGSLIPEDRNRFPSVAIYTRLLKDTRSPSNGLTDDELIVTNYRIFGFVLRSRKWAKLDLTHLSPIDSTGMLPPNTNGGAGAAKLSEDPKTERKETSFDQLVLPPGHKEMVLSLIAQHYRDKESGTADTEQVDIVRGKGKGLIILLHGAPGVGKTTTAEGVAELFKKPLFQITCGDLGTTAGEVEVALETNFALANRWGCILLLDEADVFLTARSPQDFKRNGLVAVFLRVLEYYAGILFLTTNRIGDFDEAFASRVHISLHYPQLDLKSTLEIFKLNLQLIRTRFQRKGRKLIIDEDEILAFAEHYWTHNEKGRWNGRQIRNGCQTALALAEFKAQGSSHERIIHADAEVKLQVEDLKTVSSAYLDFYSYLTKIYGKDLDRRAKAINIRALETSGKADPKERGDAPVKPATPYTPSLSSQGVAASTQPGASLGMSPAYPHGIPTMVSAGLPLGNYIPVAANQYYHMQPGTTHGYPPQNTVDQMVGMGSMGLQPGQQPGQQPGMQPGMQSGLQPGQQPGMQSGLQSGLQPGLQPGLHAGLHAGLQPGQQPRWSNYNDGQGQG